MLESLQKETSGNMDKTIASLNGELKKVRTGKQKALGDENIKDISYSLQKQITDEMRRIWLSNDGNGK